MLMWHGGQGPARYLGGSHHCCCGCHVQASLPEVHKGIITPVFCLDQAIIDFLSKEKQRHTEQEGSNGSLFFLPSPETLAWHLAQSRFSLGLKSWVPLCVCVSKYKGGGGETEEVQGNGKGNFET